jgi:hypothetical protein
MAISIKALFTTAEIRSKLKLDMASIEQALCDELAVIGLEAVNVARSMPADQGYHDVTGNLRSSTGMAVFKQGRAQFKPNFATVKDGSKGKSQGEELTGTALESTDGITLVVVAGMEYASDLEARGRDVLSSAEHYTEAEAPSRMKALKQRIMKA